MNYNYENEKNRYQGYGFTPPPETADSERDAQYKPPTADNDPPLGAPPPPQQQYQPPNMAEPQPYVFTPRTTHIETQSAPDERPHIPEWSLRRRSEVHTDDWREPSYREPSYRTQHDMMSNMYTPGIYVNNPYTRKREPAEPAVAPGKRRGRIGGFLRAVCLILVCALLSGAAAYGVMEYRFARGDGNVINQVVLGGSANLQHSGITAPIVSAGTGMSAEDIYDMALTQVVGIRVEAPNVGAFGNVGTSTTAGSGFIISADGYILTNFHVIEPAQQNNVPAIVSLHDGSEFNAEIIGYEISNDVALLKINATGLNPAVIANSDNIRVGQTIYAVGNPFGDLVYTMTDGIVSALDRIVTVDRKIISTFQFSAAVNSGNSGGPIYDTNGEVVGIVTAKIMRNQVEGIGFAIPINDAIEIASGLIEHGYIAGRPLIGITGNTVTSGHAEYYGWVVGSRVRGVNPGSAAEKAGLLTGDIITAIGDVETDSMDSLRFALRRFRAGDTTTITVWRNGTYIEKQITFDEDLAAGQPQRPLQEPEEERPEPRRIFPFP